MESRGRGVQLLLLLIIGVVKGADSCTNPFVQVGTDCLFFGNSLHVNQPESRGLCEALNGRLYQIDTAQQLEDLVQYLNNSSDVISPYWIDGSDSPQEGRWLYTSGDQVPMGTPFWATWSTVQDEEAQYPTENLDRNCVGLDPETFFFFQDVDCFEPRGPLCEESEEFQVSPDLKSSRCDGLDDLTGTSGTIVSPGWPNTYPEEADCYWRIKVGTVNHIRLSFVSFDLYPGANDILTVRDGYYYATSPVIGEYNGFNQMFPDIISTGNYMTLVFKSTSSLVADGFELHWRSESNTLPSCIEEYTSSEGQLYSPLFPEEYSNNLECKYTISTQPDQIIRLTTAFFETDSAEDYLKVYDGGDSSAPLLVTLSGIQHNVPVILSTGNQLYITFTSDDEFTARGFNMAWTSEKSCPLPFVSVGSTMCLKFLFADLTFGQATVSCVADGGSLAAIKSAEQLRDFFLYINQFGIADADYWVGGSDVNSEGEFTWQDGSLVPMGTPFWGTVGAEAGTQEPNGGDTENCLALTSSGFFYFRDQHCTSQHKAVCMHQK